ncbi:MAG: hypothetical protein F2793_01245, partial [Actinobacteria bacterium]|nr:hypothetical protein [Actinomycetota bacterium]
MRPLVRPIPSLLGAALLATALVSPALVSPALGAPPARAAEVSGREVTTYLTIEGRRVASLDTAASTAGDATFTDGSVAVTDGGPAVGAFATKAIVVIPDRGGRERRDTTVEVSLP